MVGNPYFTRLYGAEHTVILHLPFHCALCGFTGKAEVEAHARGLAWTGGILRYPRGGLAAQKQAEANAYTLARFYLDLRLCPACRSRDPEAVARLRRFQARSAFAVSRTLLLAVVFITGLSMFLWGLRPSWLLGSGYWAIFASIAIAGFPFVFAYRYGSRIIADSDRQARFPDESPASPAGGN